MTKATTHIIQQQILEINIEKKEWASDIQDRVSEVYHSSVLPMLDEMFSAYSHGHKRIRIDKLELDIGSLNMENLEEDLLRQLKPQLEEKLTKLIYKARNNQGGNGVQIVNTKTNSLEGIDAFYDYLKTGHFPWWTNSTDKNLKELINQFVLLDWSASRQQKVFFQLIKERTSRRRLIDVLEPAQLKKVFLKINKTTSERVFAIQKDIVKCLDVVIEKQHYKNLFAFYSMDKLVTDFFNSKYSIQSSAKTSDYILQLLLNLFSENEAQYTVKKQQLKKVEQLQQSELCFLSKDKFLNRVETTKFSDKEKQKPLPPAKRQLDETEKIEIVNAGLVLVWPYIQIFFRELGLLEGGGFKHEEAQWKAIHLLHYLATGQAVTEEQELLLPKLMCDCPLDAFVMTHFELDVQEKEECDHLLKMLIKNWPVLKKTSVIGLQQTFIQRAGMLSKDGNIWSIQIERASHDILLERLNWSISNIKLPWNDYLIQVKW